MDDTFQIAAHSSSMSDSLKSIQNRSAGEERLKSDKRQFSGLMFALSICVTYFPLANLATAIGPNDTTPSSGLPLAGLIAACILVFVGSSGMMCGYLGVVHDYSNKFGTGILLVIIQLTWMPFVTDLYNVGSTATSGVGFIPETYEPTQIDVKFVGAMGIVGICTYASAFVGSFAFMAFALYAYQDEKPTQRNSAYYKGRLFYYSSLLFLAGISQLFLGIYIWLQYGRIVLFPPIRVAVYTVSYSEVAIAVGGLQTLMGFWGMARRFGILVGGKSDHSYQFCAFFMWLGMLGAQIVTQIGIQPGGEFAAAAPSYACLFLGISIMSPFLDYKMRTTPDEFPPGYFGISGSESSMSRRIYSAQEEALRAYDSQVAPDVTYVEEERADEDNENLDFESDHAGDGYNDQMDAHDFDPADGYSDQMDGHDFDAAFDEEVNAPSDMARGSLNPKNT